MSDGRRRAMVRLSLATNVGPLTCAKLLERFGEAEHIFGATEAELTGVEGIGRATASEIRSVGEEQVDAELAEAEKNHVHIVVRGEEDYPQGLGNIPDAPVVLYVRGELRPEDALAVAMVGTRRASLYGRKQARRLSAGLASYGFTIVSGLARGIDTECHEGALAAGGRTIAVLGTGLAAVYPAENAELYMRIAASGAVVSEFPMRFPALTGNFPRRNRIISGLSLGVVVVEAGARSGALITARHAMEQNREVFAVPGMVDSPGSEGCHRLIRDGAHLVTGPSDVVDELGPLEAPALTPDMGAVSRPQALRLNDMEKRIYGELDSSPRSVDELAETTGLGLPELSSALTILEMRKLVKRLPGQCFARS